MSTTTGPRVLKKMMKILFLEGKPVFRTSGCGSSSASHTMLERLFFIVKKEAQPSSPLTTSVNLLGPFGSHSCNQLQHWIFTLCSFCFVVNWWGTNLAHLLGRPSCSWTIAHIMHFHSLHQAPRLGSLHRTVGHRSWHGLPARASSSVLFLPSVKC